MTLVQHGNLYVYRSGDGLLDSKLEIRMKNGQIAESHFTNFSSGMNDEQIDCGAAD
jgi:hypothetical protein